VSLLAATHRSSRACREEWPSGRYARELAAAEPRVGTHVLAGVILNAITTMSLDLLVIETPDPLCRQYFESRVCLWWLSVPEHPVSGDFSDWWQPWMNRSEPPWHLEWRRN
jgi:hypothetical protein